MREDVEMNLSFMVQCNEVAINRHPRMQINLR